MPAPTLVADYDSAAASTTTPKTASVTDAVGDLLVAVGGTGRNTGVLSTPTGGTGLSWTSRVSVTSFANECALHGWTSPVTTAQTFSCSVARTGTTESYAFSVARFSNHGGVGAVATNRGSGGPTCNITTTRANSALVVWVADFNAASGTSRAWRTTAGALTEMLYTTQSGQVTLYCGVHQDVGAVGSKTVGLSAPTGQLTPSASSRYWPSRPARARGFSPSSPDRSAYRG